MKLLAFSDVHLDSKFGWANREVSRRQRQRLRDGVSWAFEQARHEGAAAVLIGGDLFEHELVSPDTVEFLRRTFERSGLQVFAAPGNHDYADTESPYRRVDWPDNVHIFSETRFTSKVLADGLTVWGAAHRKPADTPGFFDDGFRVGGSGTHIGVFHGEERSAAFQGQYRHAPFESDQIAAAGFDHAVVGHSHKPADQPAWTRLGSLERLKFNEAYGTAVILEIAGGRVTPRRLEPRPPTLHTLSVDLTEVENASQARDRVRNALSGLAGAARIRLTGEPDDLHLHEDDFTTASFELPDGVEQVLVDISGLTPPYDLEQIEQEPTVRGMFVQRVREDDLDPETERLVLLAGLRALDGRDDLAVIDELRMGASQDDQPDSGEAS
ncbi:MAG: metallophosphoesterase [Acidobacteria bacterium]|nr:metallophosphoesterase [Acidobacteriota bacterium]